MRELEDKIGKRNETKKRKKRKKRKRNASIERRSITHYYFTTGPRAK